MILPRDITKQPSNEYDEPTKHVHYTTESKDKAKKLYEEAVKGNYSAVGAISSFMRSLLGGVLLLPEFLSGVSYLDKRFFNLAISSFFLRS